MKMQTSYLINGKSTKILIFGYETVINNIVVHPLGNQAIQLLSPQQPYSTWIRKVSQKAETNFENIWQKSIVFGFLLK